MEFVEKKTKNNKEKKKCFFLLLHLEPVLLLLRVGGSIIIIIFKIRSVCCVPSTGQGSWGLLGRLFWNCKTIIRPQQLR